MSIAKEIKTTSASSVRWKWIILVALPVAAFLLSFPLGRYPVSLEQLITVLAAKVFPIAHTWPSTIDTVIFKVRLPRIIAAMLVGAALATSGAAYQGMFKNPLVSPDILGASAGAGFGAALAIFFSYSYFGIQIFSFLLGQVRVSTPSSRISPF
jgi:iron complex transport system permease protein